MERITKGDAFGLLRQVNLNHLMYFWAVGQTGSVTAAAERLGVSQPGVTKQIRLLEHRLGVPLLERGPRGVTLTQNGRAAMRYVEEIVGACTELVRSVPQPAQEIQRPILAGTADAVPKVVIRTILKSLMQGPSPPPVICREWRIDHLLSELSLHRLDLVISDTPLSTSDQQQLRSYTAMSSAADIYAAPTLARKYRRGFPDSLSGAPLLLPAEGTSPRDSIDRWFALHRIRPRIAAEAEDRSLLHHFAEAGLGLVPVASVTAPDVVRQFGLTRVGRLENVREDYFLITVDRQNEHLALSRLRSEIATWSRKSRARSTASNKAKARRE
jgi:LysR family transcriptional activator of nhaA